MSGSVSGLLGRLGGLATGRTARDGATAVPTDRRTGTAGRPAPPDLAPYRAILDDHLIAAATRTDAALSAATVAAREITVTLALAGDTLSWKCYRYRVFETIVPIRNAGWRPT